MIKFMKDLRNFNEVFSKDVNCDNVKSHKKLGLYPLFEEITKGVKLIPRRPVFKGLTSF